RDAAMAAFLPHRALFDDHQLTAFLVLRDAASIAQARNQPPGLRWFFDPAGELSRLYGALDTADLFARLEALPSVAEHAGVELCAPVLIAPRVFEPELCRRLIALYESHGGAASGVMRDVDGRTVGVMDNFKRRRDMTIEDPALRGELMNRIARRLVPEIAKVFQFQVTRLERYLV